MGIQPIITAPHVKLRPNSTNKALTSPQTQKPQHATAATVYRKHSLTLCLPHRTLLLYHCLTKKITMDHSNSITAASLTGQYLSTSTLLRKPRRQPQPENNTFLPLPKREIHKCLFHITSSTNLHNASLIGQNLPITDFERNHNWLFHITTPTHMSQIPSAHVSSLPLPYIRSLTLPQAVPSHITLQPAYQRLPEQTSPHHHTTTASYIEFCLETKRTRKWLLIWKCSRKKSEGLSKN